jgi:hypothetical protein
LIEQGELLLARTRRLTGSNQLGKKAELAAEPPESKRRGRPRICVACEASSARPPGGWEPASGLTYLPRGAQGASFVRLIVNRRVRTIGRMDNDTAQAEIITPNEWRAAIDEWRRKQSQSRPVYVDSMSGVRIVRGPLPDVRSLSPSATDGQSAMRLRYQLVVAAYAVAFVPALLLSDSGGYGGRFEWGIFWSLGLVVPTIAAALILLISWVTRVVSAVQRDRRPPTRSRHRR